MKNNRPKCPSHQIKYVRPKYAYFVSVEIVRMLGGIRINLFKNRHVRSKKV